MNKEEKNDIIDEVKEEFIDEDISTDDNGLSPSEEEIKLLNEEVNDLSSKLLRLQADFVNFRKRAEKEKEGQFSYGVESFAAELLPILDNFERALNAEVDKEDSFYKGVSLINNQIMELLKKNSITELKALGEAFDPNFHHAVVMEESKDYKSNTVIEVLQKGYLFKEKVIRPSMVKVSI